MTATGGDQRLFPAATTWRTPLVIIVCGCAIGLLSFGPRSSLGFFIQPMSREFAWGRDVFGLALAVQNLLWGLGQPVAGAIADRFGVLRVMFGSKPEHSEVDEVMERAISAMKQAGAVLIDIDAPELGADQLIAQNDVQKYEFKAVMDRYLATIPNAPAKTVDAIYAGGRYNHPTLEGFLKSAVSFKDGLSEADYQVRLDRDAKTRTLLEKVMDDNHLDAVVYPLQKRLVVPVTELNQADRNGILASVTGFPAITVPAGFSAPTKTAPLGVPVGMDILGKPWSEAKLLSLAYSFEQATHFRRSPESAPPLPSEK